MHYTRNINNYKKEGFKQKGFLIVQASGLDLVWTFLCLTVHGKGLIQRFHYELSKFES